MKTLLDEQLDRRLKENLPDLEVFVLNDFGWLGLRNGQIREKLNEHQFQFLITADKNMPFQQHLGKMNFTLILLDTPSLLWPIQELFVPKLKILLNHPPVPLPKIISLGIPGFSMGKKKLALLNLAGKENILFL